MCVNYENVEANLYTNHVYMSKVLINYFTYNSESQHIKGKRHLIFEGDCISQKTWSKMVKKCILCDHKAKKLNTFKIQYYWC